MEKNAYCNHKNTLLQKVQPLLHPSHLVGMTVALTLDGELMPQYYGITTILLHL